MQGSYTVWKRIAVIGFQFSVEKCKCFPPPQLTYVLKNINYADLLVFDI